VAAQNPLERTLLLALGAAALTRERVQEVVDEVVRRGELTRREGKELVDDLMEKASEQGGGLRERLDANLQDLFRQWGLATHAEWEELNLKVAQLEHRLSLLEGVPAAAVPKNEAGERETSRHDPSPEDAPASSGDTV
jgi:polyhydroxyalkanoate synthesis regulator phasin